MERDELVRQLTEAGNKFDGHVTNGSITAQMEVLDKAWYNVNTDRIYAAATELIAEMNKA